MATTISDLLQPQTILDVVSRIKRGRGRLGQFFGFHATAYDGAEGVLSGPNTRPTPTRSGVYRIYDNTRTASVAVAPGAPPATISPQPIGEVAYTCIRWHEKIRLYAEELNALARIVGPNSVLDTAGKEHVVRQLEFLTARMNNAIEVATLGMMRGKLYLKNQGEKWIPTLTLPTAPTGFVTVDFRIPAGNLGQLDMLGTGAIIGVTWANPAAPILSDLMEIDAAMVQLSGESLKHVWVDGVTWGYVLANTQVINAGGTSNTPFASYERVKELGYDGQEISEYTAILRGYPHVIWHIINDVIIADGGTDPSYAAGTGVLTKAIPDGTAVFMPEVTGNDWVDFLYCGEHISEQAGQPMVMRMGWHFWSEWITQPTCVEVIGLFNGIPRLRRPRALASATVVF